ncbi:MAG TPA: TonB-dependent receptor plug domain-containing protein [Chitinophagaceae bacterium]|nr:TonB-dependent receptor plug domain-containing protein [Chitinophagaceae bacterium]
MKRIIISGCLLFTAILSLAQQESKDSFYTLSPVEVRAVRAADNTPVTKTNLSKKEIVKNNLGQDIPFLLNQTPSVVVNSDAGNAVGYTGIRIRGTDATRINITLNGIPYNDAESQGTFFVDLPDFSSSAGSIQVQRGVGTSSNGAGAFGASINFSTNEVNKEGYAEFNNSFGSFNTWKNTIKAGTGLKKNFTADIRLSRISSDGFIDRASSNLKSLYFTTAYIGKKNSLRFNLFTGKEKTYQAWNGISQTDLDLGLRTRNSAGTERPGSPYENETDNYTQTHYQLFFNQQLNQRYHLSTAFFLTSGEGYYEQYKYNRDFKEFGLPYPVVANDTVFMADFVRQLWLDNKFYGNIFSLQYKTAKTLATLGGAYTRYEGNHYGKVIWSSRSSITPRKFYDLDALKTDFNIYLKQQTALNTYWSVYYDLQYRHVKHHIEGFRNNPSLIVNSHFSFFNPKAGISYRKNNWKAYASFSIAGKEPNRDDFEAGTTQQPKAEHLYDTELGIEHTRSNVSWGASFYYMSYKDQLVLTGKINDVGAYTRTNIPWSYRAGVELQGTLRFNKYVNASANLAFSSNKVRNFVEYIDDYDNGVQITNKYSSTDIAFSPAVVSAATINILPLKNIEVSWISKYVSKQYLDNTSNDTRRLDAFFVQDLRAIYTLKRKKLKKLNLIVLVNNIFNNDYEPNGYTFSYIYGGTQSTENFYFPMAGVNFMIGINLKF